MAEALARLIQDVDASSHDDIDSRWTRLLNRAETVKRNAIACANESQANTAWFLHRFCEVNVQYLQAWTLLRANRFYDAWVLLERIEISCATLFRNRDLAPAGIDQGPIASQVEEWQKLFPYAVFASPEMVVRRYECSICGQSTDPWSGCAHRKGRVYMGQDCYHIAREVSIAGISLVDDPVQKYSVIFPEGGDRFSYEAVRFVRDRLISPRDRFTSTRGTAFHPHERFANVAPTSPCPCESGSPYGQCCLTKLGVVRPHLQVQFSKPVREDLPAFVLP